MDADLTRAGDAIATKRATGSPALAIRISSPSRARSTSFERLDLASCMLTIVGIAASLANHLANMKEIGVPVNPTARFALARA